MSGFRKHSCRIIYTFHLSSLWLFFSDSSLRIPFYLFFHNFFPCFFPLLLFFVFSIAHAILHRQVLIILYIYILHPSSIFLFFIITSSYLLRDLINGSQMPFNSLSNSLFLFLMFHLPVLISFILLFRQNPFDSFYQFLFSKLILSRFSLFLSCMSSSYYQSFFNKFFFLLVPFSSSIFLW